MELPAEFLNQRKLETLVENRSTFRFDGAELHIFETHKLASQVLLQFQKPALLSMIEGKKVMYLPEFQPFYFLPGESLVIPCCQSVQIDFPEASMSRPTRCLTIEFEEAKLTEILSWMNNHMGRKDGAAWSFFTSNFHFVNDCAIHQILQRCLFLLTEAHPNRDLFLDNMLRELLIRILQPDDGTPLRSDLIHIPADSRMAPVIGYIRDHISEPFEISDLSKKACMSPSHFHRVFKKDMGLSPLEFIRNERLKLALSLLQDPGISIKEIYMRSGFLSRSYFNRVFKWKYHMTPGEYRKNYVRQAL